MTADPVFNAAEAVLHAAEAVLHGAEAHQASLARTASCLNRIAPFFSVPEAILAQFPEALLAGTLHLSVHVLHEEPEGKNV